MKKNKMLLGAVALAALLFSACNDVIQGTTEVTFPTETQTFTVSPSDTIMVTFTASSSWQLSSDAMWCRVDGLFLDTNGKAGEQSVAFVINADGHSVNESKANITLRMGNESGVIAVVTRTGITNAIVVGCDTLNYKHNQTVTIGTSGTQELVIRQSTFDINNLYITKNAEWFDVERVDTIITLSVKAEYLKYSQHSITDSIYLSDKDTPMLCLNVQYSGMDAQKVILQPSTQWALKVSSDGLTYKESLYETLYEAPVKSTITVLNDAYTLYYAIYDNTAGCVLVDTDSKQWFAVQDDKSGHVNISFDANEGGRRKAYVFVLPQALNDSLAGANTPIANMVSGLLFEKVEDKFEIKETSEQYLIAEFTQENALADFFSIQHGTELYEIDFTQETDAQWLEQTASHGVPANAVFRTQLEFGTSYNVNPKLSAEAWKPDVADGAHIELYGKDGQKYVAGYDYKAEPAMTEDDLYYYMQFQMYLEEDFVIYFIDDQGNHLKALVVEPIL